MQPKFISIVGAGGKTTALRVLARALASRRVLVTTTTHMFPVLPPDCRTVLTNPATDALLTQLRLSGAVCAGRQAEAGKLCALSPALLTQAAVAADIVLCEADGAHCLPLKLHRADEPVLVPQTDLCLDCSGSVRAWQTGTRCGAPLRTMPGLGRKPGTNCWHSGAAVLCTRDRRGLWPAQGTPARAAQSGRHTFSCDAGRTCRHSTGCRRAGLSRRQPAYRPRLAVSLDICRIKKNGQIARSFCFTADECTFLVQAVVLPQPRRRRWRAPCPTPYRNRPPAPAAGRYPRSSAPPVTG